MALLYPQSTLELQCMVRACHVRWPGSWATAYIHSSVFSKMDELEKHDDLHPILYVAWHFLCPISQRGEIHVPSLSFSLP